MKQKKISKKNYKLKILKFRKKKEKKKNSFF
jgi:hypothetical protein